MFSKLPELPEILASQFAAEQWAYQCPSSPAVSDLLQILDLAVIEYLNSRWTSQASGSKSYAAVKSAYKAVLHHPESTWYPSRLSQRIREVHFERFLEPR